MIEVTSNKLSNPVKNWRILQQTCLILFLPTCRISKCLNTVESLNGFFSQNLGSFLWWPLIALLDLFTCLFVLICPCGQHNISFRLIENWRLMLRLQTSWKNKEIPTNCSSRSNLKSNLNTSGPKWISEIRNEWLDIKISTFDGSNSSKTWR